MPKHFNTDAESTQVFLKGREIGGIVGDTFRKHIVGSRHILRKPRAIAFDVSTLRDAENVGAVNVLVIDDETGAEYRASVAKFCERGFKVSRGFGGQIALLVSDFNEPDEPEQTPKPQLTQFDFFHLVWRV